MDLQTIRYAGDRKDTEELYKVYNVEQIIQSHEGILKEHMSFRDQLLASSVRLTPAISPRVHKIVEVAKERLGIVADIEFFSLNDKSYNAFAFNVNDQLSIVFTSSLLEAFSDEEILFVLGHELGHIIFEHNRLLLLYNPNEEKKTFLPILAEKKFLSWQKKAEISSDRIGLVACGNYQVAVQALLKVSYGLTEKNLNFNMDELMKQLDELTKSAYISQLGEASHPILPVRLKSLELFVSSEIVTEGSELTVRKLENAVAKLIKLTSLYPRKDTKLQQMKFVTAAAISLIASEKDIELEEIKSLVQILADYFTDEPEKEIIYDKEKIAKQLETASAFLKEKGSDEDKFYALHFVTIVALADGQFTQDEKELLVKLAASLGYSADDAMGIIWKTLQHTGIKIDVKLNQIAKNVKKHYMK